jgi:hypothetical protein
MEGSMAVSWEKQWAALKAFEKVHTWVGETVLPMVE